MTLPKQLFRISLLLILLIFTLTQIRPHELAAQTSSDELIIEDFSNGFFPPRLNNFFNHSFTIGTAWDLSGVGFGDPISQSAPFALTLYAGNEDRITFNNFGRAYVTEAEIWGYASATEDEQTIARGRIVFEGRGDSKTFEFSGLVPRWQQFLVTENTIGDDGSALGEIIAIRLTDVGNNGYVPYFDDLRVISRTPPRTSDLSISTSGPPSPVNPGAQIDYALTVMNGGPDPAVDTLIENVLPYGASFLPNRSDPSCREEAGGVVLCRLGTLPVNGQRTLNFALQVSSDTCRTLSLRSVVSAFALDQNPIDNTAVFNNTTPNPACADFAVTHSANPQPPDYGDPFAYQITVRNDGTEPAGATLTHTLPASVSVMDIRPGHSSISCTEGSGEITCTLLNVPAFRAQTVEVVVRPSHGFQGMLQSETAVSGTLFDPDLTNNQHTHRFSIGPRYDYTIMATVGQGELSAFDRFLSIDLDQAGNVAFAAWENINPTEFGVYLSDGDALTTILTPEMLPALEEGLEYHINNDEIIRLNDLGEVALSIDTFTTGDDAARTQSAIVVADENGVSIPVSLNVDDANLRFFGLPILLQNNGEMTTALRSARSRNRSELAELITYNREGEVIFNHLLSDADDNILGVGRSYNGIVFEQRIGRFALESELNVFYRLGNTLATLRRDSFTVQAYSDLIPYNDQGYIVYQDRLDDNQTGISREIIFGGYGSLAAQERVAFLTAIGYPGRAVGDPAVNNEEQIVFSCFTPFCKGGLYTGQPAANTTVIQSSAYSVDGSPVSTFIPYFPRSLDINDRGQIAFVATLRDGREVIVRADPTQDNDGDGRSDVQESYGPRSGDGNFDGINDGTQPHVATFPNAETGGYVTFESDDQHRLQNVVNINNPDPDTAPPNVTFPIGHFQFEVTELEPGGSTTVTLYTPRAIQSWWKYGPTPANPTPHWYEFTYDGRTGAEILAGRVVLHFVDGERGDSDLTANGVILDPGAPAGFPHTVFLPSIER